MGSTAHKNYGHAHVAIVLLVILLIICALGFVYWKNFSQHQETTTTTTPTTGKVNAKFTCAKDESTAAVNHKFCSEQMRMRMDVPQLFAGKFEQVDAYDVFSNKLGEVDQNQPAGKAAAVYRAKLPETGNVTMTIAEEPLRTHYTNLDYKLARTFFDAETKTLTELNMENPSAKGAELPSMKVGDVTLYRANNGDAGKDSVGYLGVVGDKIVKITLSQEAYMGDPANEPTSVNFDELTTEFDKSVKTLTF